MFRNRCQKSFTLIEIIVVVTIIGILSTVGFGAYTQFKHRFVFESIYQEVYSYFTDARQFMLTNKRMDETMNVKYFEIEVDSESIKFAVWYESGDDIMISSKELDDRYIFELLDNAGNALNTQYASIKFYPGGSTVTINNSDADFDDVFVRLKDVNITARNEEIYINSLSAFVAEGSI